MRTQYFRLAILGFALALVVAFGYIGAANAALSNDINNVNRFGMDWTDNGLKHADTDKGNASSPEYRFPETYGLQGNYSVYER